MHALCQRQCKRKEKGGREWDEGGREGEGEERGDGYTPSVWSVAGSPLCCVC